MEEMHLDKDGRVSYAGICVMVATISSLVIHGILIMTKIMQGPSACLLPKASSRPCQLILHLITNSA